MERTLIPEPFRKLNASVAALPSEFYHWLDMLSVHEVPAEMRSPLRQYHAMPEGQRHLTPELLWSLFRFPWEEAPAKIQPHLRSLSCAMCEVLANEFAMTIDDGKLKVTSRRTGDTYQS